MTDQFPPPPPPDPASAPPPPPAPEYGAPSPYPAAPPPPVEGAYQPPVQYGAPIGKIRPTGTCILLSIVTLGIYSYVWFYKTHEEMKRYAGEGIGGLVAFILQFFIGVVTPFFTSAEIGKLQARSGQPQTVTGTTGLWYFPGIFLFFIGPIVWFVKTNGAINNYWRSQGAQG